MAAIPLSMRIVLGVIQEEREGGFSVSGDAIDRRGPTAVTMETA